MRRLVAAAACAASVAVAAPPDPREVARRAITKFISEGAGSGGDAFGSYSYGPAIMNMAAIEASQYFPGQNYTGVIGARLDNFTTNPDAPGYKLLHGIKMPFDNAVGDGLGLFPIAYMARLDYFHLGQDSPDWKIAVATAQQYIDAWPYHLPDGTLSRMSGWPGEPTGKPTFVWADDSFMGLALYARLVSHGYFNASAYIDIAAAMQQQYAKYLKDPVTGLFHHGYDDATKQYSCCAWGRANGWLMMSHVEALRIIPASHPQYATALAIFQAHAAALAAVQDKADGRWHQVLDHPETYLETSVTSMAVYAMAQGVLHGWLDKATYDPIIRAAWLGLSSQVQDDGTVNGICIGTGVGTTVDFYQQRPTTYTQAAPGLGAVFRACLAYDQYIQAYGA